MGVGLIFLWGDVSLVTYVWYTDYSRLYYIKMIKSCVHSACLYSTMNYLLMTVVSV